MAATRSIRRNFSLLLIAILAPLASTSAVDAIGDAPPAVYWVDESADRVIQPMDPISLADAGSPVDLAIGPAVDTTFSLSADGSTAVFGSFSIEETNWSLDLRVVEAATGHERASFLVPGRDAYVVALSRDGSRLVVSTTAYDKVARLNATIWTVYDTGLGKQLSSFGQTHRDGQWYTAYVDDRAEHMWLQSSTIEKPNYSREAKLGALVLQHVDLTRGIEAGRLTLGSVEVGFVEGDQTIDQTPVFENVQPAIALAPDGRTLAIVEFATEQVILLDGMTLSRINTVAIHEPASLFRRLLGWVGLLPATAEAKMQVGDWRSVTFSADGESLYLTGGHGELNGDTYEDYEAEWIGVQRVDIASGEVTARALEGEQIDIIVPVANGDIYLLGPERPWTGITSGTSATVVRRQDGSSLATEAYRTYDTYVWQLLVTQS